MKLFGYEIKIKKVKKQKKTGFSRKVWTASETNTLLRLRSEGKSIEEISKLLNRTRSAINARLYKVRSK